ncbi:site-2 protease family protein [Actinomyces bowdenii]|uniref:Peptidase M50 n=1 Tax=Actinomyces bowdenii TaxID=131109 RepID=A0A3P1UPF0_9ACTO|nr:site-2 protease family protein [Actinomyces bowdenii]RRD22443.1 peptidase M50 [Actinomyces bowdenii]
MPSLPSTPAAAAASPTARGEWVLGRLGGAPIVVAPTSALLGLLIAASWYPLVAQVLGPYGVVTVLGIVLATVLGVGVSVLLHELAHGAVGSLLGRRPIRYELYLWGGLTTFGGAPATWSPWRSAAVSLSGPATNLALWAGGRALQEAVALPVPVHVATWALTWVNLALAIFNALPGLPLDGGHALASLIEQATGNRLLGLKTAAWGGLGVVALILWWWVGRPLILAGQRPDTFSLFLAAMVAWTIGATSWRTLGLGRGARAAQRLDLRTLARPIALTPSRTPIGQVRRMLDEGAALVLVRDGDQLLGAIDQAGLEQLDLHGATGEDTAQGAAISAGQVCTVLPAAALTSELTGPAAAQAMSRARAVSRWLVLIEAGRMRGAVPTGAR